MTKFISYPLTSPITSKVDRKDHGGPLKAIFATRFDRKVEFYEHNLGLFPKL